MDESAFKGHLVRPPVSKDYPASVDWRKNGSVTPVRAQGNCNSGWAFTAVSMYDYYRGGSRISGKGVCMYKGMGASLS